MSQISINFKIPASGYPRMFYFNRLKVEEVDDGHRLAYFGLANGHGFVIDSYAVFFSAEVLRNSADSFLKYLSTMGFPASMNPAPWVIPQLIKVDMPTTLTAGSMGPDGELTLCGVSVVAAMQLQKEKNEPITTQPLAILRSDMELHKVLLALLFQKNEPKSGI